MKLRVWVNETQVGWLERDGYGSAFTYDPDVDPSLAVSLTMPVRTKSYSTPYGMLPAFDTSIPEGILRETISKRLSKIYGKIDAFDLLQVTGGNQIGRVRILPDGSMPERRLPIDRIDDLLEREASKELVNEVIETYALRSGVSGAMPKVLIDGDDVKTSPSELTPMSDDGRRATLQTRDWILKFDAEQFPGLSLNEYYGLEVARLSGCKTAEAHLSVDKKMLAVRRFDTIGEGRLGFEDLASLNAKTSEEKYMGSLEKDVFKRVEEFSGANRRENLEALFRESVVNIAVRNGDAHLKNFALLYDDPIGSDVRLAPAYDIVTTTAYESKDMMALSLGGSKRWPKPKALMALGARAKLTPQKTSEIILQVASAVAELSTKMKQDFKDIGQSELGEKIAAEWEQSVKTSLGIDIADIVQDPFSDASRGKAPGPQKDAEKTASDSLES